MPRAPKYNVSAKIVDTKVEGLDKVMARLKKELEAVNTYYDWYWLLKGYLTETTYP